MKVEIDTKKLYYGFPVILLGYKDDKWKYNVTTTSSSYSLKDMVTVGVLKTSNCAKQIKKYREFTINVPPRVILHKVEMCGFYPAINKIGLADLTYDVGQYVDAPLIDECVIAMECVVEDIVEFGDYYNIVAKIKRRVAEDCLVDSHGKLIGRNVEPIYFIGDEHKRIFRYSNDRIDNLGENMECRHEEDLPGYCG